MGFTYRQGMVMQTAGKRPAPITVVKTIEAAARFRPRRSP